MVQVERDWWKDFFNEIYLITDARSVCDEKLTFQEVDFVEDILKLKKADRILDLCGGHGRHSLELARRGYQNLTVLDYSKFLIDLGKKTAKKDNLRVKFHQADARQTGLADKSANVIIVMANSFGYFPEEKENYRILQEATRLLCKRGKILLDLTDRKFLIKNFQPFSWHEASDDIIVCRMRELDPTGKYNYGVRHLRFRHSPSACSSPLGGEDLGEGVTVDSDSYQGDSDLVKAREIVLSRQKGLLRDRIYCERLYSKEKISHLLRKAGFEKIKIERGFSPHQKKADYGFLTSRMIVTARKRACQF